MNYEETGSVKSTWQVNFSLVLRHILRLDLFVYPSPYIPNSITVI